jgi:CubicO group peptidase (beta-lactamase class C family)
MRRDLPLHPRALHAAGLLVCIPVLSLSIHRAHADVFPGGSWAQLSPQQAGLDVAKLQEVQTMVGGSGFIVRGGYQVYAWGDLDLPRNWASASKPVVSTMLFLAADEGLCSTTSPMSLYMSGGSSKDRAITFHQLANMTSGYSRAEGPGQAWAYNDYAIQLYGYALYHGVYGGEPSSVFPARLAFMQFEDDPAVSDGQYGRLVGVSIRDFARVGLLWLRRGQWSGVQRIDSAYFDLVSNQVPTSTPITAQDGAESWDLGSFGGGDNQTSSGPGVYGYNFWVNANGLWPGIPADVFQASGHGGQEICTVFPTQDIVAAGVGAWGAPGSSKNTDVLQLLVDAVEEPVSSLDGSSPRSWGAIKAQFAK